MNQTKFEDTCSKCKQPCIKVRRVKTWKGNTHFVSVCCGAPPLAVPVVKE